EDAEEAPNEIIRLVSVIRGNVQFRMCCQPSFNYGTCPHQLQMSERNCTFLPADSNCSGITLCSTVAIAPQSQSIVSEFSLQAGEKAGFVLIGERAEGQLELNPLEQRFLRASNFWRAWLSKSTYKGRWREMVHRSALLLKLLISRKHGSLIAAPTFSLPEGIG